MAGEKIVYRTPAQVFDLWTKALRSGKYRQADRALRKGSFGFDGDLEYSHCCLGVLCDLARKDGGPTWLGANTFMGEDTILPTPIQKYLGIDTGTIGDLMDLNDSGNSFKFIASYIDKVVKPDAMKRLAKRKK